MIEPTTRSIFLLEKIWPLLKIGQISGTFPFKKYIDENGQVSVRQMNKCMSFTKFVILIVLCLGLGLGIMVYIMLTFVREETKEVANYHLALSKTATSYLYAVFIPATVGSSFAIIFINYRFQLSKFLR